MALNTLNRNSIETGGFHGIVQKRLIVHPKYGPQMGVRKGTWAGVGNLIYLADSWFTEGVATGLHPHSFIDVLTFVVEGQLDHEGSLEHGVSLKALDFQVQKSGKEGFMHNEVNHNKVTTRMLQLWLIPEKQEEKASFRVHQIQPGPPTKVYGSTDGNTTQIEAAYLKPGDTYVSPKMALIYLVNGSLTVNNEIVEEGVLFESNTYTLKSNSNSVFIVAYNIS